jgi:subtilisin family serine protease
MPRRQPFHRLRVCELCATIVVALAALTLATGVAHAALTPPDDPLTGMYGWQFDGDGPMGIDTAWSLTTGGPVLVAVLDTGIDASHPDLAGEMWANAREIPGNGIDDDHDGYVDDVNGWNFVAGNGNTDDDNGHGTHVAGIIGADGNNDVGTTGVDWNVSLMAVKVLDSHAAGDPSTVARGIRYAIARGARIINLSLAAPLPSPALRSALTAAQDAGVLIVAAAGNWGESLRSDPEYPASYQAPNVISVAASNQDGALDPTSNYGSMVDIAAPGTDIVSTARGGGYELRTGTSMATAVVSGAAALVASEHPDWRWPQLRTAILSSARHTGLRVNNGAALDAGAAVQWTPPAGFDGRVTHAKRRAKAARRPPSHRR